MRFFVAVLQLLLAMTTGAPNARLRLFGRGLGRYMAQIADFESLGTEEWLFPFNEWPAEDTEESSTLHN